MVGGLQELTGSRRTRRTQQSTAACNVRRLVTVPQLVLSLLLVAFSGFHAVDASYAITIEPGSEECYTFMTPNAINSFSTFSGSFEVLHDDVDSYELSVKVVNIDTGDAMHEVPSGTQEGDFELTDLKQNSKYSICFQNNADQDDEENEFDVGFNIRFHDPPRALEDALSGPDQEHASKLVQKASKIQQDWDILEDHFEFLRNREGIHYGMNNEIMGRLATWTYVEAALVIVMAMGQVNYWKKFFEKRRYL
mmetsp:Transcript_3087/g.6664  ORF Transcript_3087/g.6664 Transcript_3087/m.6664 type:complete len:251 (-) Transcript_3087:193-945(-)|eukprot:CAMPEP_0168177318 /NCGR_PEP_ID=MMETSP0139_2-20121125/8376_1 /TAXON_ID=44445 /ORGANISM="Pseudo-nitzschia australis, Strain 10249 10 AB" /LENGTH=250 /DNA_ID=CAMNT_0008096333 /DNA_START=162 /DNA_END=914 /DNA_ORIENTATION=-